MKRLIPKSEFGRNVLTLMTGTSIAQAIPIAVSPVLTRVYTPLDFGVFALYSALVLIIGSVSTGRFELAITLPREDDDAFHVVLLSICLSLLVSLVLLIIVVGLHDWITLLLGNPHISLWLYFLPLNVLLSGVFQSFNYWLNRNKGYRVLAFTNVVQASTVAGSQFFIGASVPGPSGLVLGTILGQLISVILFIIATKKSTMHRLDSRCFCGMKQQFARYKKFLFWQVPTTLMGAGSAQLPVLILGILFGPTLVGYFSLSQRAVRIPISIIGNSMGDVFRQEASRDFVSQGDATAVFKSTLRKLVLVSTPFFLVFFFAAPDLFSFVFGAEWRIAGEYAQILTPLFWLSFIVSPLGSMMFIAERQEMDLALQIFLIVSTALALQAGYFFFDSPKYACVAFTFAYSVKYFIELYLSYKYSKNEKIFSGANA